MATASKKQIQFVGIADAAKILGVTPGRVRHLVGSYYAEPPLKAEKLGERAWLIAISDLKKYAKKNEIEADFSGF